MEDFLPQYLARIGLDPTVSHPPTVETLAAVQIAHLRSIPFENFDVVLRKQIDIGVPAVFEKLVVRQRGGYCFEQNTLFMEALRRLGFEAVPVLCRVRWNRPKEVDTPFTHLVILAMPPPPTGDAAGAEAQVRYLVDVGFGGLQCLSPLNVDAPGPEATGESGTYRLEPTDGGAYLTLQWQLRDDWHDMYKFANPRGRAARDVGALLCDQQVR